MDWSAVTAIGTWIVQRPVAIVALFLCVIAGAFFGVMSMRTERAVIVPTADDREQVERDREARRRAGQERATPEWTAEDVILKRIAQERADRAEQEGR